MEGSASGDGLVTGAGGAPPGLRMAAQTRANFYDTRKSSKNLDLANPNCDVKSRWGQGPEGMGAIKDLALIESLGKGNIKAYKSEEDVDKPVPEIGFGTGMYEEEDKAQHESGEIAASRAFARAQNPTARDVTPALGCHPELNHHDFLDDEMEEDDSS